MELTLVEVRGREIEAVVPLPVPHPQPGRRQPQPTDRAARRRVPMEGCNTARAARSGAAHRQTVDL